MKKNDTLKILHKNSFGIVAMCKCCNEIQVRFGTTIINFSINDFYTFNKTFDEVRVLFDEGRIKDSSEKISFKTNLEGLSIHLTISQLKRVIELMDYSFILLYVSEILQEND